jgi:hypothetical protein
LSATGSQGIETDTGLEYNPSNGKLTSTTFAGNVVVPNDGDVGSVGATDAMQISSGGIVTFKDDIKIKDGGTIGSDSDAAAMTIASSGQVTYSDVATFSGGLKVPDDGDIGSASATDAMQISSAGIVTFKDDIILKDAATIGVTSSTSAISISSGGAVTANAGVNVDNINIDGTEIDLSSGDLTVDVEGDIVLDANGGEITLSDNNSATGKVIVDMDNTNIKHQYDGSYYVTTTLASTGSVTKATVGAGTTDSDYTLNVDGELVLNAADAAVASTAANFVRSAWINPETLSKRFSSAAFELTVVPFRLSASVSRLPAI